jgi:hypothetical protein
MRVVVAAVKIATTTAERQCGAQSRATTHKRVCNVRVAETVGVGSRQFVPVDHTYRHMLLRLGPVNLESNVTSYT